MINDLTSSATVKVGGVLPPVLRKMAATRDAMSEAIREVSWFSPPEHDRLGRELDGLIPTVNRLLERVESALTTKPSDAELPSAITACRKAGERLTTPLTANISDETPPQELVREVFGIGQGERLTRKGFDVNALRGLTSLSAKELDDLGNRMLGHLTFPDAQWVPSPIVHLSALLLAERPLIAHRMALSTRDLVHGIYLSHPAKAVSALVTQRQNGQGQFASYAEIAAEIETMSRAHDTGDDEGAALATARLYAALAEGPLRGAIVVLLRLHRVDLPSDPSLTFLRDTLRGRSEQDKVDLSQAVKPEWRNAVDHRQFHWDPAQQLLRLRGDSVTPDEVFNLYAFGAAGVAGVECGVALAVAAVPELLNRVDKLVPLHKDRVLVEHRLAQQLAAQGVKRPSVRTTPRGVVMGPIGKDDIVKALGAMIGCMDVLQSADSVEVQFEDLPSLLVTHDALRRADRLRVRDAENNRVLDADAAIPIFVSALMALGTPPQAALKRGVESASRSVAHACQPVDEMSRRALARRIRKAARRGQRVVREVRAVTKVDSADVSELKSLLQELEQSADKYVSSGEPARDSMLNNLRRFFDAVERLPSDALPWFPDDAAEASAD